MSDLNDLLKAIIKNPEDDTLRLAYADELQNQDSVSSECPVCKGKMWILTEQTATNILLEDYCIKCWSCDKGVIHDTFNNDVAKFIREEVGGGFPKINPLSERRWPQLDGIRGLNALGLNYTGHTYQETFLGEVDRGFLRALSGTYEKFLLREKELIWHSNQTVDCPNVGRHAPLGPACEVCGGGYKNKLHNNFPRPCPDTAQPVLKVHLIGDVDIYTLGFVGDVGLPHRYSNPRWPGVTFLINTPVFADPFPDVPWGGGL